MSSQNEYGTIKKILMKHPKHAYLSQENADKQWQKLHYPAPVDMNRVMDEFESLLEIIKQYAAEVLMLPEAPNTGLDSIYTHDPLVTTNKGMILLNMGKPERRGEAQAMGKFFEQKGISIRGWVEDPGTHEGGDSVWIDENTLAVGSSFRTNREGISQLKKLAGSDFEVVSYGLPWWNGPDECLHIMSFISPIDKDLAVIYPKQMPIPMREDLDRRGYQYVVVPDSEYDTFGPNVLALAPRVVVIPDGNPLTKAALEAAGCKVYTYPAEDITCKGGGGPTCLTRALERE